MAALWRQRGLDPTAGLTRFLGLDTTPPSLQTYQPGHLGATIRPLRPIAQAPVQGEQLLWALGEPVAAEERYEALIRRYPNFAWGYIGLADCFWLGPDPRFAQLVSANRGACLRAAARRTDRSEVA